MKWLIVMSVWPVLGCQAVDGDRILGKDLAAASPLFSALDPGLQIAASPMAGVRRVLRVEALLRLVRDHNIRLPETPLGELCFERATDAITEGQLMPLLEAALGIDGARIEILDYSRYGIPRGPIVFTRAGLSPAGLWRGHVGYADGRTAPVWAKVRITTEQTWVEARTPLAAGRAIDAGELVVRNGARSPFGPAVLDSIEDAVGRTPVHAIQPGTPMLASMLVSPREVERGDKVTVDVSSGSARLSFDGTAQSPGRAGESVLIRNPESGRLFHALVESKGRVMVKL